MKNSLNYTKRGIGGLYMVVAYIVVIAWFVLEIFFNLVDKGGKR